MRTFISNWQWFVTALLKTLLWLSVAFRIKLKLLPLALKAFMTSPPASPLQPSSASFLLIRTLGFADPFLGTLLIDPSHEHHFVMLQASSPVHLVQISTLDIFHYINLVTSFLKLFSLTLILYLFVSWFSFLPADIRLSWEWSTRQIVLLISK